MRAAAGMMMQPPQPQPLPLAAAVAQRAAATPQKPIRLDKFLNFIEDVGGTSSHGNVKGVTSKSHFTPWEKRRMLETYTGDRLARAMHKCEGHNNNNTNNHTNTTNNPNPGNNNNNNDNKKYVDCLSYMTCPLKWNAYEKCWNRVAARGGFRRGSPPPCRSERHALEACVDHLVQQTVRASSTSTAAASSSLPVVSLLEQQQQQRDMLDVDSSLL